MESRKSLMDVTNKCFRYILEKINKKRKNKFDYAKCIWSPCNKKQADFFLLLNWLAESYIICQQWEIMSNLLLKYVTCVLQYKISDNVLYLNKIVFKSALCSFHKLSEKTAVHLFSRCLLFLISHHRVQSLVLWKKFKINIIWLLIMFY